MFSKFEFFQSESSDTVVGQVLDRIYYSDFDATFDHND